MEIGKCFRLIIDGAKTCSNFKKRLKIEEKKLMSILRIEPGTIGFGAQCSPSYTIRAPLDFNQNAHLNKKNKKSSSNYLTSSSTKPPSEPKCINKLTFFFYKNELLRDKKKHDLSINRIILPSKESCRISYWSSFSGIAFNFEESSG
jgi:hypothetical protein